MKEPGKRNIRNVIVGVGAVTLLLVLIAGALLWIPKKNDKSYQTTTKCSDYPGGLAVWPDNLAAFSSEAYGIVVGTIQNPQAYGIVWKNSDPAPRLQITEVLKGSALHKGDTVPLCGNTGPISFSGDNHTVLIFLDGKNQNTWVPLQGNTGIIPQSQDGRFKRQWADKSQTNASVSELHNLIK